MKNVQLFLISILLFMTANVKALEQCCYQESFGIYDNNFYAKIFSGANFLENGSNDRNRSSYQAGYIVAGSLGYCLQYGLRVETEFAYRRNAIRKMHFTSEGSSRHGHFQTSSWMANLLWDLPLRCISWKIDPFIGAGIGCDFQQQHASNSRVIFNQKWRRFSWQLMAGLGYPIFCNTEITLEYKYHQGSSNFNHHSLGVGLIYRFAILR